MLSPRPILLACATVLALALGASPAGAVSYPVSPVVTGGKITYSGGVSGSLKSTNTATDEYFNENAGLDFSMVSYAGDLYGGLSVVDDGGASAQVKQYTQIPGSGSLSARFRHWDPDKGYTWENVTCQVPGKAMLPPQPARAGAGRLNPGSGVAGLDWVTGSTCSKPESSGHTGSVMGTMLSGIVGGASISVGGTPPAGTSKTFDIPFNDDNACPPNGLPSCRYSYSGEGHAKVECAVCLTNVQLEQIQVHTGDLMDVPTTGTIDGNRVFVTATFTNNSPYTIKSIVNWRERVSKRQLIDAGYSSQDPFMTFPAGQSKKVTFEWDTSGFAWEKGAPKSDRELEIRTGWGGGYVKVKVLPKPVVAVHGWNADYKGWDTAKQVIPSAIHPELKDRVYAVGDAKGIGIMDTDPFTGDSIAQNAAQEAKYVQSVRETENAQHVDLVAHSMGGLISRYYIHKLMPEPYSDYRPAVAHLVMLGTPNMGSPCADLIGKAAWGTPTDQLKPGYVDGIFNKEITNRRLVPFSLMAGDWNERTCSDPEHGDLVVSVPSAWWTIGDVAKTYAQHMELTDLSSIYSSFVKPRVGQDPDQLQNVFQMPGTGSREAAARPSAAPVRREAAAAADAAPDVQTGVAQTVTVPAGGSVDVAIPVGVASALSVGTTAPAGVSSTLIAPGGAVADAVAAGSDAARSPMRFQRAASPAAGGWTLRLAQAGGSAAKVAVVAAFEGSPLVLKAARDGGRVSATLRDGGAGVAGATVVAELRSPDHAKRTLTLHDDGAGAYSAAAADLPAGEWFGTVHATSAQGERFADLAPTSTPADPSDPSDPGPGDPGPVDPGPGPGPGNPGPPSAGPGGPGGGPTGAPKRKAVVKVSLSAKQKRVRRAPYRFTFSGKLSPKCPARTKVLVSITSGRRTVARTTVTVTKKCTFSAKVKVTKRAKLRATAAVLPSASVTAAVSRPLALRAG